MYRYAEIVAWLMGICLIGAYVGMRAWSAHASEEGIALVREARTAYAAETATAVSSSHAGASRQRRALHSATPDTSTWSTKRLAEYRDSLQSQAMPQAVLRIPRLKLEVPVYDGASDLNLNLGAARIAGTAELASNTGNLGIAAHRDGFFRPLKDIAIGDEMYVDTVTDTRLYRVTQIRVVDPTNVSVLDATPTGTITLVTCYPFYYVGSAPQRFVVHAQRSSAARPSGG